MSSMKFRLAIAGGIALALGAMASSASAGTGCNGYVNQAVWGCAPWDNNNGPQYPHYKSAAAARSAPAVLAPSALAVKPAALVNGNGNGLVASGGGNGPASGLVASGGGNIKH